MLNRNLLIDYLKGLAIFLVVWGHSIQASTQNYDFFSNPVFTVIYSFHMPLFIFISGYLFYPSQAKRSLNELVKGKTMQILIPTLVWGLLFMINDYGLYEASARAHPASIFTPRHYLDTITGALWFLWSLFISTLLVSGVSKLAKDALLMHALLLLVVCLLPNREHFYFIKFVLPYFSVGYLYHKYKAQLVLPKKIVVYLSFVLYPILFYVWRRETFIYIGGESFSLLHRHDLIIVLYRYAIGFAGIIVFATVIKALTKNIDSALLQTLSKYSLGVFLISGLMTSFLSHTINLPHGSTVIYSLVYTLSVAIMVCSIACGVAMLMAKNAFLNRYLLGGR